MWLAMIYFRCAAIHC
ncbi:hypothetical protein EE612_046398 [Oryza sativa]|nr:hypothetical protein EE612_046398 [Oryza sativa]